LTRLEADRENIFQYKSFIRANDLPWMNPDGKTVSIRVYQRSSVVLFPLVAAGRAANSPVILAYRG
jgi:hypothetical protein